MKDRQLSNGQVEVKIFYPKGEDVPGLYELLFEELHNGYAKLEAAKLPKNSPQYEEAAIKLAAEFYHGLISIHGAWDGVGRTSKLTRDWALQYMGLPAPAYTPANDLEMTADELAKSLREGIHAARAGFPAATISAADDLRRQALNKHRASSAASAGIPQGCHGFLTDFGRLR